MEWIRELKREDLSDELKFVCDCLGFETVKDLIKNCSGVSIYIPKAPPKTLLERVILKGYTGERVASLKLARDLKISINQFEKIAEELFSKNHICR